MSRQPRECRRQEESSPQPGKPLAQGNPDTKRLGGHEPKGVKTAGTLSLSARSLRKQARHRCTRPYPTDHDPRSSLDAITLPRTAVVGRNTTTRRARSLSLTLSGEILFGG